MLDARPTLKVAAIQLTRTSAGTNDKSVIVMYASAMARTEAKYRPRRLFRYSSTGKLRKTDTCDETPRMEAESPRLRKSELKACSSPFIERTDEAIVRGFANTGR